MPGGDEGRCVVVVHAGCGTIPKNYMTPCVEEQCRKGLRDALITAYKAVMEGDASAVEAAAAATVVLEDNRNFNAGRGSVFTCTGTIECDAGIMDSQGCGGVSCTRKVMNPILAAVEVMQKTHHSLICGSAADDFAGQNGVMLAEPAYFYTEKRWDQLQLWRENHKNLLTKTYEAGGAYCPALVTDHSIVVKPSPSADDSEADEEEEAPKETLDTLPQGTVGVVVLDKKGALAATSSTGGLTGKMDGRVSDSSIAGAGFYVDDRVAVSGSGNGDHFIKTSACHELASLVRYAGLSLEAAAKNVVFETLGSTQAGVIAVDRDGNISLPYNTDGFYRGYMTGYDNVVVNIWDY